jgi:hypothetical protein
MNMRVLAQPKPASKSVVPPIHSNLVLRRRATDRDPVTEVPPIVHDVLNSPGQPLDSATRAFMEPRFGHDFGHVRVHTDVRAAESARDVHAHAYTVGNNVVFGANEFVPASHQGRELLAHELAHTIQQRSTGAPAPSSDPSGIFESSASAAGRNIANGGNVSGNLPACGIGLARAPVPPSAFDDQQLDDEIKRATQNLKPGEDPGWWLTALQAEKSSRASRAEKVKTEREQRAAAERERKDRAAAVAEVEAAEARWKQKQEDQDEPEYTSMALEAPGRKGGRVVRQRVKKPRKPVPAPWEVGDAMIKQVNDELKKANEEIDARIDREREIAKRSYYERFYEARRGLRDIHEEARLLSAEQVWNYGVSHGLFLESERKAVYEDQGASEEDLKKENERTRMKFEYEQQQRRDQFYQNLQLAPIQATLMGGAGGFAQAANLGTRAIAAGTAIEGAYTTYAFADTAVQMHRAATTGNPSDVVGAALPLASGFAFGRMIGGGGPFEAPSSEPFSAPDLITPSRPTQPRIPLGSTDPAFWETTQPVGKNPAASLEVGKSPVTDIGAAKKASVQPAQGPPPPAGGPAVLPGSSQVANENVTPQQLPRTGTTGDVAPAVTGEKQGQPTVAMAGKRRAGEEHKTNIRSSTEEKHQTGQTRTQRQNEAADLRNKLAREEALQSRVRQFVSKLEGIIKNLSPKSDLSYRLKHERVPVQERYEALLNELSAVERQEIETLRTQLRKELDISGAELDGFVIGELDRVGLLPRGLQEE